MVLQLISRRYERGSTSLTSNKIFGEWAEVCSDNGVIATAILDHLLHRSHLIYRLRGKRKAGVVKAKER